MRVKSLLTVLFCLGVPLMGAEKKDLVSVKNTGTGFFITNDGYILTNHHVVEGASNVSIKAEKGELSAKIIKVDKQNDLAVLKVDGKFAALPVVSSRKVGLGDEVFTIGFPQIGLQGVSAKYTKGDISSLTGIKDDPRNFQISVPIQPGNSGGPLVNEYGNVVGIVVARLNALKLLKETGRIPQNVNYAVKSSFANSFLESLPKVVSKLKDPNPHIDLRKRSDLIREAQAATVLILVRSNSSENLPSKVTLLSLYDKQLKQLPETVKNNTQLTILAIAYNQLTSVKGLEKHTQLRSLNLFHNQLASVKGLEKLAQLETLILTDNPDLTKAQIDELQKALPNCKIYSNPTK